MIRSIESKLGSFMVTATALVAFVGPCVGQSAPFGPVTIVSRDYYGQLIPGGGSTGFSNTACSVSEDGKMVAFASVPDIDPMDTNQSPDGYLYDEVSGQIRLLTKDPSGVAFGGVARITLSADGRSVVAEGFLPLGVTGEWGVMHADISNPAQPIWRRLTFPLGIAPSPTSVWLSAMTPDLEYVVVGSSDFLLPPEPGEVYQSPGARAYRIKSSDLTVQRVSPFCIFSGTTQASVGAGAISHDGRYVFFDTGCPTLVPGDTGGQDIFVRDFVTDQISCVSTMVGPTGPVPAGGFSPYIVSGDGNCIVMKVPLQTYLGPQAPTGQGLVWRNRITGQTLSVNNGDYYNNQIACLGLSYDGSRLLMVGGSIQTNLWEWLIRDLHGAYRINIARKNDGSAMQFPTADPSSFGFYASHWTINERWLGGVMQTVPYNYSLSPPDGAEFETVRLDLGPARNLGGFVAGSNGIPEFRLVEGLSAPTTLMVVVENLPPLSQALLATGPMLAPTPIFGGIVWPWPPTEVAQFTASAQGTIVLTTPIPLGLPSGYQLVAQVAVPDSGAPFGVALSNGLLYRVP